MLMSAAVTVRQLPAEEYPRLAGLPIAARGGIPDPGSCAVLVAEDASGAIIGLWAAFTTIHLDGLWVAPSYRKTSRVAVGLLRAMKALLAARGWLQSFTYVDDSYVLLLALKAGFTRLRGDLLWLDLRGDPPCPPSP